MSHLRFDKITPGSIIEVAIGGTEETVFFLGVTGTKDDREANFTQRAPQGDLYDWSAYRFNGRWVYGSSADPIKPVSVVESI